MAPTKTLETFSFQVSDPEANTENATVFISVTVSVDQIQSRTPTTQDININISTESASAIITCFQGNTVYWTVSCSESAYIPVFSNFKQNLDNPIFVEPPQYSGSIATYAQNTGTDSITLTFNWLSPGGSGSGFPITLVDGTQFTLDPYVSCN